MPDYPDDILAEIAEMKRQIALLFSSSQQRAAITKMSDGLILPNRSTPDTPSGGAHVYGSGGEVMVRTGGGATFTVEPAPTVPQGAAVDQPPVFTSPSAPASVTVGVYQALRDDCQSGLRSTLIQLITSLRNAGLIDT